MDQAKYSLSDLYDIRNNIDAEKHPSRYSEVEKKIEDLKKQTIFKTGSYTIIDESAAKWLGIVQILIGLAGISLVMLKLGFYQNENVTLYEMKLLIPIVANILLVTGGVLLRFYKKIAGIVSVLAMLFFTISFKIGSITHLLIQGFSINLGYSSSLGFFINFELGRFISETGMSSEAGFMFGVNLFALMYLVIIATYKVYFKYPDNYIEK